MFVSVFTFCFCCHFFYSCMSTCPFQVLCETARDISTQHTIDSFKFHLFFIGRVRLALIRNWPVKSQIIKSDLLHIFGNKELKVTDRQCGQSDCQRVIKLCVCLQYVFVFPHLPPSVTFSGALCAEHEKAVVVQRVLRSWILRRAWTMLLLIWKWQKEWEKDSPTDETETDLQLLSKYNQHH